MNPKPGQVASLKRQLEEKKVHCKQLEIGSIKAEEKARQTGMMSSAKVMRLEQEIKDSRERLEGMVDQENVLRWASAKCRHRTRSSNRVKSFSTSTNEIL